MHWARLGVLAVAVLSAGCLTEILPGPPVSTLAFACAAIDPVAVGRLRIVSYTDDRVDLATTGLMDALTARIAEVSGRNVSAISRLERPAPPEPEHGWNENRLAEWVRNEPFLGRGQVTLRVLWLTTFGDGTQTAMVPAPGAVVLSQEAIITGAARLDRAPEDVALAVLLHVTGHALGVTNRGMPVQDPELQEREGPPGHDADPASVLAVGWDDARTMAWAANATYDHHPAAALADWQAAREPGGVCEVRR
ncbi:MAG: hypothetical protein AABY18_03090 [Candidatus Thermoplasmatota archaeon]